MIRKQGNCQEEADAVIAPYGLAIESITREGCVVVEFKPGADLESHNTQATLELIAANYHSNQMAMVILTDLRTGAIIYSFTIEDGRVAIAKYVSVTIVEMALAIKSHLITNCIPSRTYQLNLDGPVGEEKPSAVILRNFKTNVVSRYCILDCL
jgi:hypothetical protein